MNRTTLKRILTILLAVAMLFSDVNYIALAKEGDSVSVLNQEADNVTPEDDDKEDLSAWEKKNGSDNDKTIAETPGDEGEDDNATKDREEDDNTPEDGGLDNEESDIEESAGDTSGDEILDEEMTDDEEDAEEWDLAEAEDHVCDEDFEVEDIDFDELEEAEAEYSIENDNGVSTFAVNAESENKVVEAIVRYVKTLNGSYTTPYYKNGKKMAASCCAYVNQVWKNVFGNDFYDLPTSSKNIFSNDGETANQFLTRTKAKAGDIILSRYYNSGKWSTHFMIVLGYDNEGIWVTDGWVKNGKTVINAAKSGIKYKYKYSGSKYFKEKSGSHADKAGAYYESVKKTGVYYRLYRIGNTAWNKVAGSTQTVTPEPVTPAPTPAAPTISNVSYNVNEAAGTYTISAVVSAPGGLNRVQFPTWTTANGQDDLCSDWSTNGRVQGSVTNKGNNTYQCSYTVRISDHKNERGDYKTEIWAYDNNKKSTKYECKIINMNEKPGIVSAGISKIMPSTLSYTAAVTVVSETGIDKITCTAWTEKGGKDDVKVTEGTIIKSGATGIYYSSYFTISAKDHNNEQGVYCTSLSILDKNGKTITINLDKVNLATASSGTWGDNLTWSLTEEGNDVTLSISGQGEMKMSYEHGTDENPEYPWRYSFDKLTRLVVGEGVTSIASYAFRGAGKLREINLPDSLTAIGSETFGDCKSLTGTLVLSENINLVSGCSFLGTGIEKVVFAGNALEYRQISKVGECSELVMNGKCDKSPYSYVQTEYFTGTDGTVHTRYNTNCASFEENVVIYYNPEKTGWTSPTWNGYQCYPNTVNVTGISLPENNILVMEGETKALKAVIEPADAAEQTVSWSSSDESVAEVDEKGVVTGIRKGHAVLYAVSKDGQYSAKCDVTVAAEGDVNILLSAVSFDLEEEKSRQLTATLIPQSTTASLVWNSDDESVATVDQNGIVKAVGSGMAVIRVGLADDEEVFTTCIVNVTPRIKRVFLDKEQISLIAGDTCKLMYQVVPDATKASGAIWKSSAPQVAYVVGGKVTACDVKETSQAVISVTIDGKTDNCIVTVKPSEVAEQDIALEGTVDNGIWIAGFEEEVEYTGKAIKQTLRVYDGNKMLEEKKDYTILYKNNTNAAKRDIGKKAPTLTVKLKGNYSGSYSQTFTIKQVDISAGNGSTAAAETITVNATGKVQKVVPEIEINGIKLKNKKDFTILYGEGDFKTAGETPYSITVTGKGNYTGTRKYNLMIVNAEPMNKVSVSKVPDQTYTGLAIRPHETLKGFTATYKGEPIDKSMYDVTYRNNVEVGTAQMILTAKAGSGYAGTKKLNFKIKPIASLSKARLNNANWKDSISFTSEYSIEDGVMQDDSKPLLTINAADGREISLDSQNYDISYANHKKAGTATVTFKGKNGYNGTLKKKYKISAYDISSISEDNIKVSAVKYCKGGAKPVPVIEYNGVKLRAGIDYTVQYKYNTAVRTASDEKAPTAIITGKGLFKGTLSKQFTIEKQDIGLLNMSIADKVAGKGSYQSAPKITDLDGKTLKAGVDYEKYIKYSYSQEGDGSDPSEGSIIYVTVTGKGNYEDSTITGSYHMIKQSISGLNFKVDTQYYTGGYIEPDKTAITASRGKTELSDDVYEIVSYSDNIRKGKGKIVLKGVGEYGGTKTIYFTIKSKDAVPKWLGLNAIWNH